MEVCIQAVTEQQFLVTTLFYNPSFVYHYDDVGIANGRKTMGYDYRGSAMP
jgi:hypothetical protein